MVYLNDEKIGVLEGDNNAWNVNVITVDISKVKFPTAPGNVAFNKIRIDVDTLNANVVLSSGAVGCGNAWSTEIDWIAMHYYAASPVIFIHGIDFDGSTFDDFKTVTDNKHIVSDNSIELIDQEIPDPIPVSCDINVPYNNSIDHNIDQLMTEIPRIAELFGTDSIHLVTHSKGGLDSRGFLNKQSIYPLEVKVGEMSFGAPVEQELKVNSLITLNTPHLGSVLASYAVETRKLSLTHAYRAGFYLGLGYLTEGSVYCDLEPRVTSEFYLNTRLPHYTERASVATDADQDGNRQIDYLNAFLDNEADNYLGFGILNPLSPEIQAYIADVLYQLVGEVAYVDIEVIPNWPLDIVSTTTNYVYDTFQPNDTIVTQHSAAPYPVYSNITGAHHMNVHSQENAESITTDALSESGMVHWRLR